MLGAIGLLTLLVVAALLVVGVWRGARRLSPAVDLKNFTVSREWLIQHQSEDR